MSLECEGILKAVLSAEAIRSAWSLLISINVQIISERVTLISSATVRGQLSITQFFYRVRLTQDMSRRSETSSSIVDRGSPVHKNAPQAATLAGLYLHPKSRETFRVT